MYYVYLLKSTIRKFFYTGYTTDLKRRVINHQNGNVTSTKPYTPFQLVYYEACLNKTDALKREKYLKSRLGKTFLKSRLKNWFASACTFAVEK